MSSRPDTLTEAACVVLGEPSPAAKVDWSRRFAAAWADGRLTVIGQAQPPDRPSRPPSPQLRPPRDMPKRKPGGAEGRIAFIHAIAHIELNAIDLAWDIVARFTDENMPRAFFDDWVRVARDEAEHFDLLNRRLQDLDAAYGDHPAHDGLWEAAETTADDLLARLALVPMVLEARGLDTTPVAVRRFRAGGDDATATILERIGNEEIPHVAAGVRWFRFLCERRNIDPVATFHALTRRNFNGRLKPPFNDVARTRAGFGEEFYRPLSA
ncbi:MAG: ferritin-like domain-containing protein [Proteobacteria bacterium]|nr:ferritin-like domain-containing protein [Pseudomonadota bacterium]